MKMLRLFPFLLLLSLAGHPSPGESAEPREPQAVDGRSMHAVTLPSVVARVNGIDITGESLIERREHYLTMMGYEAGSISQAPVPGGAGRTEIPPNTHEIPAPLTEEKERALLAYILRQLIVDELKGQEAASLGLTVAPELLAANVSQMEQQAGSRRELEESLLRGRTTADRWYTQLRQTLLLQALEARRQAAIPVSDDAIRRNWEENREALSSLWHTDELPLVQERLRDLVRQARWPAAQADWEAELTRKATIWIDPLVQERGLSWDVLQEQRP